MKLFFALLASAASLFAQIQVIPSTERISVSLPKINTNFAWLNANKAPLAHVHLVADITGFTAAVRAAHSASGPIVYDPATGIVSCPTCGTSTGVPSVFGRTGNVVAQFTDYSTYFAALLHSHALADVTGLTVALAGKEPANANIQAHIGNLLNPHGVTAAQVGLGSVDNTSDAAKPLSTAEIAALATKAASNASTTVNGIPCALGATCSITTGGGSPLVPSVAVSPGDTSTVITYGATVQPSQALPSCTITATGLETQAWSTVAKTATGMTLTWAPTAGFTGTCAPVIAGAKGADGLGSMPGVTSDGANGMAVAGNLVVGTTVPATAPANSLAAGGDLYARALVDSRTVVLLGDSVTARNTLVTSGPGAPLAYTNYGYFAVANIISGKRLDVIRNAGIGGEACPAGLARMNADVIAFAPRYAMVMYGINDIAGSTSTATLTSCLATIYDRLIRSGITPIISTVTPATVYDTSPKRTVWADTNTWIAAYATSHPQVIFADMAATIYSGSNAQPAADTTSDGTHPTALGALLMGRSLATVLTSRISWRDPLIGWDASDYTELSTNPQMNGTGGTLSGTCTGVVADAWRCVTFTGSGVASKVARTDGKPGVWQQVVVTGTGPEPLMITKAAIGGLVVGASYHTEMDFETDSDVTGLTALQLRMTPSAGTSWDREDNQKMSGAYSTDRIASGTMRTPSAAVFADNTGISIYVYIGAATGTFRIGRLALVRD